LRSRLKLGVNIDHVATLRQARGESFPDVIEAARQAIAGGADSIVAHLREDRRHIQDSDILAIRKHIKRFDMEMAATPEMLKIALAVKPDIATIVPEKRKELTTEGGLDVASNLGKLIRFAGRLERAGIKVSLFVDPEPEQIIASSRTGASFIEIHTGAYARNSSKAELNKIRKAVRLAKAIGLRVNAGHGLDCGNVSAVARIPGIEELNIGFSIIARAVFVGIKAATTEMKKLLLVCLVLLFCCASTAYSVEVLQPSAEATMFKDVPADHWAASSINDLVKMGVTQGYPDATYRGNKKMTRYEMAVFLSKMAVEREIKNAENEKIMEELRAELYKVRYSLDMYKRPVERGPVYGSFVSRIRTGNLVKYDDAGTMESTQSGPVFDYRLIADFRRNFDERTFLRVGIDTMDSSLVGGRDLAREMFEAEASLSDPSGFGMSFTSGPGLIIHREGPKNIIPSEDKTVFLRPNNGIKFSYDRGDLDSAAGFMATSVSSSGLTETNDMYGYVGYTFRDTVVGDLRTRYSIDRFSFNIAADQSSREATINILEATMTPLDNVELTLKYGVAGSGNAPHNSYAGIDMLSKEFLWTGVSAKLSVNKIGEDFFLVPTYPAILGVNSFNKLFIAGTRDVALELDEEISSSMNLRLISDIVTGPNGEFGKDEPDSSSTYELDLDLGLSKNVTLTFAYRVFDEPAVTTDPVSDLLGISFRYIY